MEMYEYKCNECSFIHIVPAYWSSFSPEKEIEMPHLNLETKDICPCQMLQFIGRRQ